MKTFFSVLICYVLQCIAGIFLSSAVIMIYIGCMRYVVGQPLNLYSFEAFMLGVELSVPFVAIFIPMYLVLSLIRHSKKNRLIGIITTIFLSLASWTIVMPLYLKYQRGLSTINKIEKKRLSSGYFRFSGNKLYYFTNVDSENNTEGILIDVSKNANDEKSFRIIHNQKVEIPGTGEFTDILVKRTVELPKLLVTCIRDLYNIAQEGKRAFTNSYWSWLFFCTIAIPLVFVFVFSGFSEWRLISAFFVLINTGIVLKINAVVCAIPLYKNALPFLSVLAQKLSFITTKFPAIINPLYVIVNIFLVLFFMIIGFWGMFKKPLKSAEDEENV